MNFNDGDWGYGLGLLAAILGGVALCFGSVWIGLALIAVAFGLCWWFG